jgi:PKD repeat protein
VQNVGPLNGNSVGTGTYNNPQFATYLIFTVYVPIRVNSFLVDAGNAGVRNIELLDGAGNPIQNWNVFIGSGSRRVSLGLELQPGNYLLGGTNLDLFRNTRGAQYPYEIPGVIAITGSSGGRPGSPVYSYFYDWEIQEFPCTSDAVSFDLFVNPQLTASYTFVQNGAVVNFSNTSSQVSTYRWDFGDGNTAMTRNAFHTYAASGTYAVTLTIIEVGCVAASRQTIVVPSGVAIDPQLEQSFQLYPNPGQGRFSVKIKAPQISQIQLFIFDLTGRQIYASSIHHTAIFEENFDLSMQPSGTYFIQLRVDDNQIIRKYNLMK